jgi:YHS domain-containing protein
MRGVLFFLFFLIVYYAVKTVIRSAIRTYHADDRPHARLMGEEMVQDPECLTYVVKDRAVTRRINGKLCSFCSDACAKQFEEKSRT